MFVHLNYSNEFSWPRIVHFKYISFVSGKNFGQIFINAPTAVRVGNTQSNMSMPSATQTTKSAANPTPWKIVKPIFICILVQCSYSSNESMRTMRYRGLSFGSRSVHLLTVRQNSSLLSPPLVWIKRERISCHFRVIFFLGFNRANHLNPPTAYPLTLRFTNSAAHFSRNSKSRPPWTIGKTLWSSSRECACKHRSSHRTVLAREILLYILCWNLFDVLQLTDASPPRLLVRWSLSSQHRPIAS